MPASVSSPVWLASPIPSRSARSIGGEFIAVFDDEAKKIFASENHGGDEVAWLVQGTLYPDVIESSSVKGPSQTIKSHHNVGGLPANMKLKLIEPLRDLFKDEVRRIGRDLGMPEEILRAPALPRAGTRRAHPGRSDRGARGAAAGGRRHRRGRDQGRRTLPQGLAVLRGAAAGEDRGRDGRPAYLRLHLLRPRRALRGRHDRRLGAAALRGAARISSRIVSEVRGINRVVYDITSKPPGTIEWE